MSFRLIHSSDLHLGKPFGRFDSDTASDLRRARLEVIATLANLARTHAADHILLAGDTFDQEAPSPKLLRQAIREMGDAGLHWWILPGNHDSLSADLIWQEFATHAPANIHVLTTPDPVEIEAGVSLLPAPCPFRHPGRDLTADMATRETPAGSLRIGLAHGPIQDFGSDAPNPEVIPPNRAETAGLDYLALGDWHGVIQVSDRFHYAGSPERDGFKHPGHGVCLLVELPGPGVAPKVTQCPTGRYDWQRLSLHLSPAADPLAALHAALPTDPASWRKTLIQLDLSGHVTLDQRLALSQEIDRITPEFCALFHTDKALRNEHRPEDLGEIAPAGALRMAAEALKADAMDDDLSRAERDIADAALARLYSLIKGGAA